MNKVLVPFVVVMLLGSVLGTIYTVTQSGSQTNIPSTQVELESDNFEESEADINAELDEDTKVRSDEEYKELLAQQLQKEADAKKTEPQKQIQGAKTLNIQDDPFIGDKSAKVALIEFSDFECQFCQKFHHQTLDRLKTNYIDTGKLLYVYKDFPLASHTSADLKAEAAECVQEIGGNDAFFDFHDQLFADLYVKESKLADIAESVGIDRGTFELCYDQRASKAEVEDDQQQGTSVGITGTPGFLIGLLDESGDVAGLVVAGAQPYENFASIIDQIYAL